MKRFMFILFPLVIFISVCCPSALSEWNEYNLDPFAFSVPSDWQSTKQTIANVDYYYFTYYSEDSIPLLSVNVINESSEYTTISDIDYYYTQYFVNNGISDLVRSMVYCSDQPAYIWRGTITINDSPCTAHGFIMIYKDTALNMLYIPGNDKKSNELTMQWLGEKVHIIGAGPSKIEYKGVIAF